MTDKDNTPSQNRTNEGDNKIFNKSKDLAFKEKKE